MLTFASQLATNLEMAQDFIAVKNVSYIWILPHTTEYNYNLYNKNIVHWMLQLSSK